MNTRITNSKLFKKLKDKKYRDLFVAGEVKRLIPFQLRALRAAREWTQGEVGARANMPQTVISRIENGNAASLSVKTLLKLAAAFDVALVIRFEPIDRLVNWVDGLSPDAMTPRASGDIMMEAELANEPHAAINMARQMATPALSLVPSHDISTTAVQQSLGFSSLRLVDSPKTTTATPLAVSNVTTIAYQATA